MPIPTSVADINAFTNRFLVPKSTDVIYKESPLFVRMIRGGRVFPGGSSITRPIMYAKLNGGAFTRTGTFDINYVVTDAAFNVNLKFYYVNITLYGTDDVLNRGREAAFSVVETKTANASMRMAELLASNLYKDGQTSGADVTTSGGLLSTGDNLDGLLAWVDDGNTQGTTTYTAATTLAKSFPSIGGLNRDDLFGSAPTFTGATTPTSAISGANAYVDRAVTAFSLSKINEAFGHAWYGNQAPDLITVQQGGWNKLWNAIQPNQRFNEDTGDLAEIGFRAFRFNGASVVVDKYMPEQVMLGLNTKYLEFYISDNPKFQMGFTGFKEAQNTPNLAGQFLFSGNLIVPNPRTCFKLVGSALA